MQKLNEWSMRQEEEEHENVLPPNTQRAQPKFELRLQKELKNSFLSRSSSRSHSRKIQPILQPTNIITADELLLNRFKHSHQDFKTIKLCHNCNEAIIKNEKGEVKSYKIDKPDDLILLSTPHIKQLILDSPNVQKQTQFVNFSTPIRSFSSVRIHKQVDYKSLKIKQEQNAHLRTYTSCMPRQTTIHSRKYSELYHEAVKKDKERREALKKIPRRRRKKQMTNVSPEAPEKPNQIILQFKPEALKHDRKMMNFRLEDWKGLHVEPIRQSNIQQTMQDILRLRRQIRLGILTRN